MKKTLYFYGISKMSFFCALMLVNPNVPIEFEYYFGALKIEFDLKHRKDVGAALARTRKRSDFRQCYNPNAQEFKK